MKDEEFPRKSRNYEVEDDRYLSDKMLDEIMKEAAERWTVQNQNKKHRPN
jgi:hypothetical protein